MIARGIRLTPLRREVLGALTPGQGVAADELKRRVALGRGLVPESPGWATFCVSFARALRLLEGKGALDVSREAVHFQRACATWVRLTPEGERERGRVLERGERTLGRLEPEPSTGVPEEWQRWLVHASEPELATLEELVAGERRRRRSLAAVAESPGP
jgi:hypothetical protein